MNPTKNKNAQRGFTLVEVIVVAIIVAALAGVAIPMYTSYVNSSRTNAAANAAGSVASFMGSCINQGGHIGDGAGDDEDYPGTTADSVICVGTTLAPAPQMQLPAGIHIVVSRDNASPGTVTATHNAGGTAQTYNY